jgi:hypothetical protein
MYGANGKVSGVLNKMELDIAFDPPTPASDRNMRRLTLERRG